MIDTKARTTTKLEALVGGEVEINGKRFWIAGWDCYREKGWVMRFSAEPPPEWLTR